MKGKRLFLYFEGVNSAADVFVNYRTVAHHLGGYTAFCAEITDEVKLGENDLEVWVSNAFRTDVLPISGDFNVYGGIHRPCHLIVTEENCISPLFYASSGVFVHQQYISELYDGSKLIDKVTEHTGFRYFTANPDSGFFLNGKPYNLYGLCRHEDVAGKGSALLLEDYQKDMELIKEIGATAIRLSHYPHAKTMYDLCDKNGILLWTEIPLIGPGGYDYTGYISNDGLKNNARQVLKELVYQNYNHPAICFWGIFNELLLSDEKHFQELNPPEVDQNTAIDREIFRETAFKILKKLEKAQRYNLYRGIKLNAEPNSYKNADWNTFIDQQIVAVDEAQDSHPWKWLNAYNKITGTAGLFDQFVWDKSEDGKILFSDNEGTTLQFEDNTIQHYDASRDIDLKINAIQDLLRNI